MNHNFLLFPFFICSIASLVAGQTTSTPPKKSITITLYLSNGSTLETSNERAYMYRHGEKGAIITRLQIEIARENIFIAHGDLLDILLQKNKDMQNMKGRVKQTYETVIKPSLENAASRLKTHYVLKLDKSHQWVVGIPNTYLVERGETIESLGFNTKELQDFWYHFKGAPPTSVSFREWLGNTDMTHLTVENLHRLFDPNKEIEKFVYVEGHGCSVQSHGTQMIAEMNLVQYRKFLRIMQSITARKLYINTCHSEDNLNMHEDFVDGRGTFSLANCMFSITLHSPTKKVVLNQLDDPDKPIRYAKQMKEPAFLGQPFKITVKNVQIYEKEYAESQDAKKGWPILALEQQATNFLYAPCIQTPVFCWPSCQYISMGNNNMNHVFQRLYVMQAGLFKKDATSLCKLFNQSKSDAPRTFYIKRLQEVLDLRGDQARMRDDYQENQRAHYDHATIHVAGGKAECVAKVLFCKESPEFDSSYVHIVDGKPQKISKEQALAAITGMLKRSEPTADAVLKASDGLQTKEMVEIEIRKDLEML